MSSKSKKKSTGTNEAPAEPKKVKIPKSYIVRPTPNVGVKSISKVYLNPEIFTSLELSNNDLIMITKEGGGFGVIAGAYNDETIESNLIGMSKNLRNLGGILLGDRITFSKYKSPIDADTITIHTKGADIQKKIEKTMDEFSLVSPGLKFTVDETEVTIIDVNSITSSMDNLSLSEVISDTITPTYVFNRGKTVVELVDTETINYKKYPNLSQTMSFLKIGGLSKQIELLQSTIDVPLNNPQLFSDFGLSPPRGILLHGPPGTGKSMLLNSIAHNTDAHILTINGPSIVLKYLGETETKIREIFMEARKYQPSVIIMDEIDSMAPNRNSDDSGETESRVVATLLTMMDSISMNDNSKIVIIGATNRVNSIDSALRRPGRFDQEIEIGIPDVDDRFDILKRLIGKMNNDKHELAEEEIRDIASKTHGYVGADLVALIRESVMKAISRGSVPITLTAKDINDSLPDIRPSAMREIFLEMPKVHWSDIGGQHELKQKLTEVIELPLEANETFVKLGISAPKGVLLYGPPGCSKTLTAKALATESGLNFLAVKGPEIFNKYVGESERAIREIFRKARSAAPSIIFFDEIDAISGDRENASTSAAQQVLTSLLNEIDGVEELKGVVIIGATNRPTEIDPALLRPGRLDRHIYVAPPDYEGRLEILGKCCKKFNLSPDIKLEELAEITQGCSGAEVTLLCQEAGLSAIMEDKQASTVQQKHFDHALKGISRGITEEMLDYYKQFAKKSGLSI